MPQHEFYKKIGSGLSGHFVHIECLVLHLQKNDQTILHRFCFDRLKPVLKSSSRVRNNYGNIVVPFKRYSDEARANGTQYSIISDSLIRVGPLQ